MDLGERGQKPVGVRAGQVVSWIEERQDEAALVMRRQ